MNLNQAVELMRAVSTIPMKKSAKCPEIHIFHHIGEGYTLRIKKKSVSEEYRNHLNRTVESYKLAIHETKRYLIIHGNYVSCSLKTA